MEKHHDSLEAIQDIRKMMKDSSRFLSLSGFAGIFAGVFALSGAFIGYKLIQTSGPFIHIYTDQFYENYYLLIFKLFLVCVVVLLASLITAFYFSYQKAKKTGQQLFNHTSKKLALSMLVPLITGGLVCMALLLPPLHHALLVGPVMLLFYGMALIHASNYTLAEIRYLGYLETVLGILAMFSPGHGLLFWAIGFGLLHIIYGFIMWYKYERNTSQV